MDRLIVKNFGPLKDVDIELNKINLFIGENGSGKSVLGKIITIITSAFYEKSEEEIFKEFKKYNINYINNTTMILLMNNEGTIFELKNNKIASYQQIELTEYDIAEILSQALVQITTKDEIEKNASLVEKIKNFFSFGIPTPEESQNKMKKTIENFLDLKPNKAIKKPQHNSQYIPAERNLISIFSKSISSFLTAEIPLPKFLLSFSSEYEKARNTIQELNLLEVQYQFKEGRDYIIYDKNDSLKNSLPLENSSSGIQSALPLYLTVKYFAQKHKSIIIEEPEQNLFPKAQKETVEYIVEQISDENSLFMMTHSPYILTALNNLILANDVKEQKGLEAIEGIVKEEQCVAFEQVSAYMLVDGKSINIMDKEDRLIGVNLIDAISDEVSSTFDTLLAKLD